MGARPVGPLLALPRRHAVLKGGSGHIVVWVDEGQNNFGWWVPREVDIAAIATTAAAAALALLIATRRRHPAAFAESKRSAHQ